MQRMRISWLFIPSNNGRSVLSRGKISETCFELHESAFIGRQACSNHWVQFDTFNDLSGYDCDNVHWYRRSRIEKAIKLCCSSLDSEL